MKNRVLSFALFSLLLFSCQSTANISVTKGWIYSDEDFMTPERKEAFQDLRMYEVFVESFVDGDPSRNFNDGYGTSHHKGDIRGIINSLDYIKSIGFNSLWVSPIFTVNGNTKLDATGYYPADYFSIDPNFGTLDDVRELVQEAHKRGLYVFFDGVFGHHKANGPLPSPSGRRPVSEIKDGVTKPVFSQDGKPVKATIDFFTEAVLFWINELGIDGWRMDVAWELTQDDHIFWEEIRRAVQDLALTRSKAGEKWGTLGYMVGETWKGPKEIANLTYGTEKNKGLWSCFDFPGRYFLVKVFATDEGDSSEETGGDASLLEELYSSHKAYPQWAIPQLFMGNHDVVRFGDLIQRATTLGYGPENPNYWKRHKAAFNFMTSYTGPVMTYYGEEIGAQLGAYGGGPDFSKKVTGTRAVEWGVADDHVGRTSAKIEGITGLLTPEEKDLKDYLSSLNSLREKYKPLSQGTRTNLLAEAGVYADLKTKGKERILYIQNTTEDSAPLTITIEGAGKLSPLFPKSAPKYKKTGETYEFEIPGLDGAFYLVEP